MKQLQPDLDLIVAIGRVNIHFDPRGVQVELTLSGQFTHSQEM